MLQLRIATPHAWVETVLADFDTFLLDHAACERKASATGMAFVVQYPDREAMLDPLIAFAREELEHFHDVVRLVHARGLTLVPDTKDAYVRALMKWVRARGEERLLDRLLMAAVVEARGCERFGLLAEHHPEAQMRTFYREIAGSEARHHGLFLRLARLYFSAETIESRLEELLVREAEIVASLPARAALH